MRKTQEFCRIVELKMSNFSQLEVHQWINKTAEFSRTEMFFKKYTRRREWRNGVPWRRHFFSRQWAPILQKKIANFWLNVPKQTLRNYFRGTEASGAPLVKDRWQNDERHSCETTKSLYRYHSAAWAFCSASRFAQLDGSLRAVRRNGVKESTTCVNQNISYLIFKLLKDSFSFSKRCITLIL